MTESTTRICFVRHGETDWNIEQRMQGQANLSLNALGKAQAAALGVCFAGQRADALYSSDLSRAMCTAAPIGEALGLPVQPVPALRERHFGCFEGSTFAEIAAQNAADYEALEFRHPDFVPPGGESLRAVRERVLAAIDALILAHLGQSLVVVTHGGVLDVINRRARGLSIETPRDFPIPNAGLNRLAITGDDWIIESWGATAQLAGLA